MPEPTSPAPEASRTARLRKAAGPLLGLVIVGLALWGLHGMLRDTSTDQIAAALATLPPLQALLAVGCTALSYIALTLYDRLSLGWRWTSIWLYGHGNQRDCDGEQKNILERL